MAMDYSSSQRKTCSVYVDRLTSLPIELIHMILQHVPIRAVVRTSALSRTWRYRWMYVPHLVFDAYSMEGRQKLGPVDYVNSVLFLHNAELFRFSLTNFLDRGSLHIDRWILILGRKMVKELILDFSNFSNDRPYKLPSCLFACQNLRVLKLNHCALSLPLCGKGFSNLVELELDKAVFTNETITSLISNSPLQNLTLYNCTGFTSVDVYAPKLRTFILIGPCEKIHFGNTPFLKFADLGLLPLETQAQVYKSNRRCNLEYVLGDVINAKEIYAHKHFVEILAHCIVPERLSVTFRRMWYISLEINLEDSKEVSVALCLFRSLPYLEKLVIISRASRHLDEERCSDTRLHEIENIFPVLVAVEVNEFKGTQAEMDIVSFILLKTAVLETMNVKWDVGCIEDHQWKALVLENMMQFKRTSPNAQVLFV